MMEKVTNMEGNTFSSQVPNANASTSEGTITDLLLKSLVRWPWFIFSIVLFVTLAFWDKDVTENVIYQKLLSD